MTGSSPALKIRRRVHIKVSLNELNALIHRAFEGCGCALADCDDCARAIVWLESAGIATLPSVLAKFDRDEIPDALPLASQRHGTHGWTIDLRDSSLLHAAILVSEFATGAMRGGDGLTVQVQACSDPEAIVFVAHECARRGFYSGCYWTNAQQHFASASPEDPIPAILTGPNANGDRQVRLLLQRQPFELTDGFSLLALTGIQDFADSSHRIGAALRDSLDEGIEIDPQHYEKLQCLGERVLVESNERSRTGAGE